MRTITAVGHSMDLLSPKLDWPRDASVARPNQRINRRGYPCKGSLWHSYDFFLERMAHTIEEKKRLLNRARRIRGQVDVVVRTLEEEAD